MERDADLPRGPDEPGRPNIGWFRTAVFDERKFDSYLLSPDHPANRGKAKGWRDIFGIGKGDGSLLWLLILEQIEKARVFEAPPKALREEPTRKVRRWELRIDEFRGPNGNVAPVMTAWALEPGEDRPHLVTAIARSTVDG